MFRRYAHVRQSGDSDCGAAALATVALHYRRPVGLEHLRDLAGTDRGGTNLLGMVRAAEKLGFAARAVKGPYDALPGVPLPAVAHLHTDEGLGHFVVLHRVRPRSVVVADPTRGVEKLSREEFCRQWTGNLLLLVPEPHGPAHAGAPVGPWRRFLGLLAGHAPLLAEAFGCALLMTALGAGTSYFIQHLVDGVLVRQEGRLLNALGVGLLLLLLFRALFGVLRQYLLAHVARKVDLALIAGFARHLARLPLRFFEMRRVGEVIARVHDAAKVREAVSGTTTALVDGSLVLLLLGVLWLYDVPLAAVATAFVPLLLLSALAHHPASRRRARTAIEHGADLTAHLTEDVSAVETIKAFGAEQARAEQGEKRLVAFVQSVFSLQKLSISTSALGTLLTAGAGLAVLWFGGHRVMSGALTVGQLLFFYSLLTYLLEPLERLSSVNLKLQDALVAVDRLYQVLEVPPEQAGGLKKAPFRGPRRGIELRDVCFRYGCRANVLEGVNLTIPAGSTVAVVGESGSGKSTLLKLLLGLYEPTGGGILVDGVDLRDFDLSSLRAGVGVVSQDPFIFNGTVVQNIALGRPGAGLEEVLEAARAAGLEEFIASLPERYETMIGERGANLSGGQRQRLAIARALLRRPEVLIFDEATSHLDTATERAIQESLKTALAGKTVVLVAHRLSTIRDADRIYVLHKGRVAEQGTHRELMAQGGGYAALWRAQTEECGPAGRGPGGECPPGRLAVGPVRNGHAPHEGVGHA